MRDDYIAADTDTDSQLFYSKRSQFVYGLEAEVTNVSVGRQVSPGEQVPSPLYASQILN